MKSKSPPAKQAKGLTTKQMKPSARVHRANIANLSDSWQHPKLGRIPIGASLDKVDLPPSPFPLMADLDKIRKPYKAISFFSGCGGGSLGLKQAGFNVLYANEFIPIAAHTYKINAPQTVVDTRDIRKVTGHDILKRLGLKPGDIDIMEGSPPCKLFSAAQGYKKGRELATEINYCEGVWQRVDDLFFEFARLIKVIKPKVFFAENVKGLTRDVNRGMLVEIFAALRAAGYHVEARILDASRMGIPQRRERLIFVGVRNDLVTPEFKLNWPKPDPYETTARDFFPHMAKIKIASGFTSSERPFDTVTASDHSIGLTGAFSRGTFLETVDGTMRRMNLQELRRASGIPDDFKLAGTWIQQFERLGRILVPEMYKRLGEAVKAQVIQPYYAKRK